MPEALETATVRSDRMRLRAYRSVLESARGEGLDKIGPELAEMAGDSIDPDDRFTVLVGTAYAALYGGRHGGGVQLATGSAGPSDAELRRGGRARAAGSDLGAATKSGSEPRARSVEQGPSTRRGQSGVPARKRPRRSAFVEGRTGGAVDALRGSIEALDRLGQQFDAAEMAVDAAILMPDDPTVRRMAEEHRPVLERVGARAFLAGLDQAMGSMPLRLAGSSTAIPVEAPSSGS